MSFVACVHAQAQHAREAAAAAASSAPAARVRPPRIMIAGGEKSGELPFALHGLQARIHFETIIRCPGSEC
jgi:hypothetical protein